MVDFNHLPNFEERNLLKYIRLVYTFLREVCQNIGALARKCVALWRHSYTPQPSTSTSIRKPLSLYFVDYSMETFFLFSTWTELFPKGRFVAVPRVLEKIHSELDAKLAHTSGITHHTEEHLSLFLY